MTEFPAQPPESAKPPQEPPPKDGVPLPITAPMQTSDEALAKSYPVSDQTRKIVEEIKTIDSERFSASPDARKQIAVRTEVLVRELSDSLSLPTGKDYATLEVERNRLAELRDDAISIEGLLRNFLGDDLEQIFFYASPQLKEAYAQYESGSVSIRGDHDKQYEARKKFSDVCDLEVGITKEEKLKEYSIYAPPDLYSRDVATLQSQILIHMWKQISDIRIAQSVYERREALIQNLAAKTDREIYRTQNGYKMRPDNTSVPERPKTLEGAAALVQEAIELSSYGDGKYRADTLRSPRITREAFDHGLPDISGLKVFKTSESMLGKGYRNTVYRGEVKGGVPGLRGDHTALGETLHVAVKTTTVDTRQIDLQTAGNILAIIEEAYVLSAIRNKQQELYPGSNTFVPDSVLAQNYQGVPALVMEHVDRSTLLLRQKDRITPQQMRSAFVQYFQLQDVIHQAGFTCEDVKGGDFFYNPDEDRLIILDWNVTTPINSPPVTSDIQRMNANFLIGLKFFEEEMAKNLTPEAIKVFQSLQQRIKIQEKTTLFDVQEIITAMKESPLAT